MLANFQPGHQDTWVDYKNDDRAPLLFISGSEDHLMPPTIQQSNAKHYKSNTITEIKEYEGKAHLMPSAGRLGGDRRLRPRRGRSNARGGERASDEPRVSDVRLTHIGGPTVLIEVGGWRLLTDPTFDPPGRSVRLRLGHVRRASSPARRSPRPSSGRSTPCCSRHDHHGDNLDDAGRALLPSAGVVVTTVAGREAARRRARGLAAVGDDARSRRRDGRRSRSPRRRAVTGRR